MYTLLSILFIAVSAVVYYYYMNYNNIAGQYYAVKGDADRALRYYARAYEKKPKPVNTLNYGYLLLRSGKLEEAEKIINSVFLLSKVSDDDKKRARMMLALVSWQKGDLDAATEIYENILEKEENTTVYANLGFLYIEKGDLEKAYKFNLRAYEYNDSNNVILDNISECCYRMGDIEGAYGYLKRAVESKQPIAENYYHFAKVLRDKGNFKDALIYAEKADLMSINTLSGIKKSDVVSLITELKNEC